MTPGSRSESYKGRDGLIDVFLLESPGLTGLEPAASALTGRCSDQLNYNPNEIPNEMGDLATIFILFYLCIEVSNIYDCEGQGSYNLS